MWDFLGILIDQLGESIRWFFLGYFSTLVLLILLYKYNLLYNKGSIGFIKKITYYLFIPLYIGIVTCFYCATYQVEKDAKELSKLTLEQSEQYVLKSFINYISTLPPEYIKEKTKEDYVDSYLRKNNYDINSYSTKLIRWGLINGIKILEQKAIDNGSISLNNEEYNLPKIISNYLNSENNITHLPFEYLKGMTYNMIHSYANKFYLIYFLFILLPITILTLDLYLTLKKRQSVSKLPTTIPLDNTQKKLDNFTKKLNKKRDFN